MLSAVARAHFRVAAVRPEPALPCVGFGLLNWWGGRHALVLRRPGIVGTRRLCRRAGLLACRDGYGCYFSAAVLACLWKSCRAFIGHAPGGVGVRDDSSICRRDASGRRFVATPILFFACIRVRVRGLATVIGRKVQLHDCAAFLKPVRVFGALAADRDDLTQSRLVEACTLGFRIDVADIGLKRVDFIHDAKDAINECADLLGRAHATTRTN